jgi:predicted PurR-regulated permease PerM
MKKKRNKTVQDEEPVDAGTFSFERFYHENRRVLIWIILGAVLWLLRSFFSLIFLTFVFAFVAAPISEFFVRRFRMRRRLAICVAFGTLVALLSSMTVFVAPQVTREAANLVGNLPKTEERLLELRRDIIARYPTIEPILMNYLRSSIPDDLLADLTLKMEKDRSSLSAAEAPPRDPGVNLAPTPAQAEMGPGEREMMRAAREDEAVIHLFLKYQIEKLTDAAPRMIGSMWAASATILLALLFSFLISLDTLRLRQEIRNLRNSRLRHFYEETALPVVRFGYVVGRTIQAQAMIAVVNTILTLIGLNLLGVPSLAVLSMIVFLCSFIPVLGVFISTIPIVLVAINSGGINSAVLVILMVIVVHALEAYLLNPMIYGKHLKINPVFVLMILFIGHHAFGVWGMLLGVPVAHYFIHDVFGVPIWSDRRLARKGPVVAVETKGDRPSDDELNEEEMPGK